MAESCVEILYQDPNIIWNKTLHFLPATVGCLINTDNLSGIWAANNGVVMIVDDVVFVAILVYVDGLRAVRWCGVFVFRIFLTDVFAFHALSPFWKGAGPLTPANSNIQTG